MEKKDIDIIILSYNRNDELKSILKKLSIQTFSNFNVIITDDGSKKIINPNEFPIISKFIWTVDNGYHRVRRFNEALEFCKSKKVVLLDDDCIPMSNSFVETHYNNLQKFDISLGIVKFPDGGDGRAWFSTANIGFDTEKIKAFGLFDPMFDNHYGHEDQDLGNRLKKSKTLTMSLYENSTSVMHIGEMYAKGDRSEAIIGHNTKYFIEKWGYDPR